MFSLRPYQNDCIDAVLTGYDDPEKRKQLIVVPTGGGKTVIFSKLAQEINRRGKRVLILAHREELINQAIHKLHASTGIFADKEKAEHKANLSSNVVVASIQTMQRRLAKWPQDHFDLIVVDESHHILAASYQSVLNNFPDAKVLGVTATPDRCDKKNLGKYFQHVAYEVSLFDLINQGYLSKICVQSIPIQIDLTGVRQTVGDFNETDLSDALEPWLENIAEVIKDRAAFRRTLVFLPLCATSRKMVECLQKIGVVAAHVDGESEDRKEIAERFTRNEIEVVCNAMLWCLDEKTEVLTDSGWVGIDEISLNHNVANWCFDGSVFFKKPEEIVRRALSANEHMVSIDSRTINIRVTDTHRMIIRSSRSKKDWKKIKANDLSRNILPSCGIAQPINLRSSENKKQFSKRNVSANAYCLRKNNGMNFEDSLREATTREGERCELRIKQPGELSLDECRLVGFWIADGSRSNLQSGGIEYILCQSASYPKIVEWIDALLVRLGVDFIKRAKTEKHRVGPYFIWSLPRGTGGGCQKRKGLFHLEPYLQKNGTPLFWGLSENQFDALVEGYWYGDGHHGQAENGFPNSVVFNDTKFNWIELLCSIGPVRGWRCAMYHMPSKNPKHKDQWRLRMIKGADIFISEKTEIVHEHFKPERVWCVKTESKNIITRRKGKVTVMGNTEGFDDPGIDCIVMLRPTKSRALYAQCVGRGTRIAPSKSDLLLLDFLWLHEKHNLIRPANLIASTQEQAEIMQKMFEAGGASQEILDLQGAASEAQVQREKKLQEELKAKQKKAAKTIDAMEFCLSLHVPDIADYEPMSAYESRAVSVGQREQLTRWGIDVESISSFGQASKMIDTLFARARMDLATPKQVRLLQKWGIKDPHTISFKAAGAIIDRRLNKSGQSYPQSKRDSKARTQAEPVLTL